MAQQKKNGIQPISYSRLHEKLGESQKALRISETHVKALKKEVAEYEKAWEQQNTRYWKMRDANISTIVKLQMSLATTIMLLVALVMMIIKGVV